MTDPLKTRVLFLCTGNSARSQIAEALLRQLDDGRFVAFSAGTHPRDAVHPDALETLARRQVSADGLRPKDLSTFAGERFDYVITVCDRALEECPVIPGAEMIHWSFPDPAAVEDRELRQRVFDEVFQGLSQRIRLLMVVSDRRSGASR